MNEEFGSPLDAVTLLGWREARKHYTKQQIALDALRVLFICAAFVAAPFAGIVAGRLIWAIL